MYDHVRSVVADFNTKRGGGGGAGGGGGGGGGSSSSGAAAGAGAGAGAADADAGAATLVSGPDVLDAVQTNLVIEDVIKAIEE